VKRSDRQAGRAHTSPMPTRAGTETAYPAIAERQGRLLAEQRYKMARSAHAYVRGATKNFYQWQRGSQAARRREA